jgi:hypothetical protein
MTELIASGTSYAASSDVTVTAGTPVSFFIHTGTGSAAGVSYQLQHKNAAGGYQTIFTLTPANINEFGTIGGAGVFRILRDASAQASSFEQG